MSQRLNEQVITETTLLRAAVSSILSKKGDEIMAEALSPLQWTVGPRKPDEE